MRAKGMVAWGLHNIASSCAYRCGYWTRLKSEFSSSNFYISNTCRSVEVLERVPLKLCDVSGRRFCCSLHVKGKLRMCTKSKCIQKSNGGGRVPFRVVMANGFQFMQDGGSKDPVWACGRGGGKETKHCGPHATVFASRWEFASSNEFGNHFCVWPQWGLPEVRTVVKQKTEIHADSINLQRTLTVLRCWPIKVGGFEWLACFPRTATAIELQLQWFKVQTHAHAHTHTHTLHTLHDVAHLCVCHSKYCD